MGVLSFTTEVSGGNLLRVSASLSEGDLVRGSMDLPLEGADLTGFSPSVVLPAFNNLLKRADAVRCWDEDREAMALAYKAFGVPASLVLDKARTNEGEVPEILRGACRYEGTVSVVADTETTGKKDFRAPITAPHQPDIVQVAAMLGQGDTVLGYINFITQADKPCHPEAAAVHGITQEAIDRYGLPRNVAIPVFNALVQFADRIVCHNTEFDIDMFGRSYWQLGADPLLIRNKPRVCTMKSSTNILKLPGGRGYKWPKLIEAYCYLVDPKGFEGAHDALIDVKACWEVLKKLEAGGYDLVS